MTGGDEAAIKWLINWIAFKVRKPAARNITAVVFHGPQGPGKNVLSKVIAAIMGERNVAFIGQRELKSEFNASFITKLVVFADEIEVGGSLEIANAMKRYITDPFIVANGKYMRHQEVENRTTWLVSSNSPVPVLVEGKTDRRYTVFRTDRPKRADTSILLGIHDANGSFTPSFQREIAAFAYALHHHRVSVKSAKRPYHNEAREQVARACRQPVEAFLAEVDQFGIESFLRDEKLFGRRSDWDFGRRGIATAAVYSAFRVFCDMNGYVASPKGRFELDLTWHHPTCRRGRVDHPRPGDIVPTLVGLRWKARASTAVVTGRATATPRRRAPSSTATSAASPAAQPVIESQLG